MIFLEVQRWAAKQLEIRCLTEVSVHHTMKFLERVAIFYCCSLVFFSYRPNFFELTEKT